MKRIAVVTLSLFVSLAAPGGAAAPKASLTVSLRTVPRGATLTISFLTPSAGPTRAYRVRLRAVHPGDPYTSPCLATLDFFNPKPVAGHVHLKFAYKPTHSQGVCTGPWRVEVKRAGLTIATGGQFTIT
ncbi:MAG: hypothetical protein QOE27_228 [Solirubrobacteraceae bacterium]|nr:hypothetical protein [Solirubrobacteraceae bacterium]